MKDTRSDITIGGVSLVASQHRNKTTTYNNPSPANRVGDGVGFKGYNVKISFENRP